MNENTTLSILQRLAVVLAVTAASYGLSVSNAQTITSVAKQDNEPRICAISQRAAQRPS